MSNHEITSPPESPVVLKIGIKGITLICAFQLLVIGLLVFRPFILPAGRALTAAGHTVSSATYEKAGVGGEVPVWGELTAREMDLQRPEEYLDADLKKDVSLAWNFRGTSLDQVKATLALSGITPEQLDRIMNPQAVSISGSSITIKPDDDLVISLSAEVRSRLYAELSKNPANYYMANPFHVKESSLDRLLSETSLPKDTVSLFKQLNYQRGTLMFFSDLDIVFRHCASENDRRTLLKVATSEPTVLVKVHIRPDTDVDKLLGYWTMVPGVHFKDLRPLVESIRRMPEGGNLSLLYFLPPFARERLYTFPLPPQPGQAAHDCFWSALNYFNETPDDRLGSIEYVGQYVKQHFYQISKPSMHGDLIFVCDAKDTALHAAIYLADDIVFTKNGVGYMQPWVLMRLPDLLNFYAAAGETHSLVFRNKDN